MGSDGDPFGIGARTTDEEGTFFFSVLLRTVFNFYEEVDDKFNTDSGDIFRMSAVTGRIASPLSSSGKNPQEVAKEIEAHISRSRK